MSFVQAARNFLSNPSQEARNHSRFGEMQETLRFMLNNAVGVDNAISTNDIIQHLRNQGYSIGREDWQIEVLGWLREHGVFIGSKRGVGMFIIENEEDAREVHESINSRIEVEEQRLRELENLMQQKGWTP